MPKLVNPDDLIAAVDAACILGLSQPSSVTTYLHRYDDFPRPVVDLSQSHVRLWLRQDIETWATDHAQRRAGAADGRSIDRDTRSVRR